jgi:hypothetical protein
MFQSSSWRTIRCVATTLFRAIALIYAIGILPIIVYLHAYDPVERVSTDNSDLSVARVRDTLRELAAFGPKPAGSHACEVGEFTVLYPLTP